VRGDPNQLLQVFFNIINNAVDAMEEGGGGTLTVRTLRERADVVVEFCDTAPASRSRSSSSIPSTPPSQWGRARAWA
jgi:signal transduction histidine kinase